MDRSPFTCADTDRQTRPYKLTQCFPASAQKLCQEATWEFPETEIELVLTQAEQKAVARTWIIVPYKVLAAKRTLTHFTIKTSTLHACQAVQRYF